jgi:ATP-binding cassette, subfamily B, bacterial CvaB/MchF/RaxB
MGNTLEFGWGRQLPVILQTEAAECGLTCLAMVASYHGFKSDLPHLRARFNVSQKGLTLLNITQIAEQLQLQSRALRLDLNDLPNLATPCILHWNLNHFVVLKSATTTHIVIHDPATGLQKLAMEQVSKHFTGVALELTPTAAFTKADVKQRVRLRDLMGQVRGLKRSLLQIVLLGLALEVFVIVTPFFMQWVVDGALVSGDKDLLVSLCIGFVLLLLIQHAVRAVRAWVVVYLSTHLNMQWLNNVFGHLLKLPLVWFEKRHLGDVVSRFGAVSTIQRALTTSFIEVLLDGVMAIAMLALMLIYSPLLTAVVATSLLVYGLVRVMSFQPLKLANEASIVHSAKQQSHFLETVRGVQSIKLFNKIDERRGRWLNLAVESTNAGIRIEKMNLLIKTGNSILFGLQGILIVWLGANLTLDGVFSVGMLFAFVAYKEQFTQRVAGLIDKLFDLSMIRLQGERLADIVLTPVDDTHQAANSPVYQQGMQASDSSSAQIELCDVKFRYADHEPWVVNGISTQIKKGECVAIVGASGCGKTTLLKCLLGLLPLNEGVVKIKGVPIKQLGTDYHDMIATVMQDDQLFAGSIADNIHFFSAEHDPAAVEAAAQMAAIDDEIKRMPMGYHTLIGDMGNSLSGGQVQRILLARALYRKPSILFLDEATSHLDVQREQAVNAAIKQLPLTRIIIAHRPETIAMADRVIVLHQGQVQQDVLVKAAASQQAAA